MIPAITYETILSEIRRHKNDVYIGKGKWSWEERLADHLLAMFKAQHISGGTFLPTPTLTSPSVLLSPFGASVDSLADTPSSTQQSSKQEGSSNQKQVSAASGSATYR